MLYTNLLLCMVFASFAQANPIYTATTSYSNQPSIRILTKTIVDTTVYSLVSPRLQHGQIWSSQLRSGAKLPDAAFNFALPSITLIKRGDDDVKDGSDESGEKDYWILTLEVNDYSVTVPIPKDDAMGFCKSISNELRDSTTTETTSRATPTTSKILESSSEDNLTTATSTEEPSDKPTETESLIDNPGEETTDTSTNTSEGTKVIDSTKPTGSSRNSHTSAPKPTRVTVTEMQESSKNSQDANTNSENVSALSGEATESPSPEPSRATPEPTLATELQTSVGNSSSNTGDSDSFNDTLPILSTGSTRDISSVLEENSRAWESYSSYISKSTSHMHGSKWNGFNTTMSPTGEDDALADANANTAPESETKSFQTTSTKAPVLKARQKSAAEKLAMPWYNTPFIRIRRIREDELGLATSRPDEENDVTKSSRSSTGIPTASRNIIKASSARPTFGLVSQPHPISTSSDGDDVLSSTEDSDPIQDEKTTTTSVTLSRRPTQTLTGQVTSQAHETSMNTSGPSRTGTQNDVAPPKNTSEGNAQKGSDQHSGALKHFGWRERLIWGIMSVVAGMFPLNLIWALQIHRGQWHLHSEWVDAICRRFGLWLSA